MIQIKLNVPWLHDCIETHPMCLGGAGPFLNGLAVVCLRSTPPPPTHNTSHPHRQLNFKPKYTIVDTFSCMTRSLYSIDARSHATRKPFSPSALSI